MEHVLANDLQKILVTEEEITQRLNELAGEIAEDYQAMGAIELSVIVVTNGAIIFAADLLRKINLPLRMDCVRVSSYGDETFSSGNVEIIDNIRLQIHGAHVLMIDDILDTGRTCSHVVSLLEKQEPASLRTCMLLEKQVRRDVEFKADYVGFHIPNEFVVGYGLDFAELYRTLPYIGILKPECQNPPAWK